MKRSPLMLLVIALHALGACSAPRRGDSTRPPTTREARLTNQVWLVSAPASRAPGSMYVFFDDGTLLMTSCVETYRLATWRAEPDGLLVSEDPTTSYQVRIVEARARDLHLRLVLQNETVDLKLRAAEVPFVCPDLPR